MPNINDRASVAKSDTTDAAELETLARDRSPEVRTAVALNPTTPPHVLASLAEDSDWRVRYAVAESPNPAAIDAALASSWHDVRTQVLARRNLSDTVQERLLRDPDHRVRTRLVSVAETPALIASLARDDHPGVRAAAVLNPLLSDDDVEMLASDRLARVRAVAASSRRLDPATLTRLASDRSATVRWNVLVYNTERRDLAELIAEDSDQMNRNQAQSQLDHPEEFSSETRALADKVIDAFVSRGDIPPTEV